MEKRGSCASGHRGFPRALIAAVLLLIPALHVARIAWFAATEAGIEHDSGWAFGVSRNLAEHGLYATSTNLGKTAQPISEGIHYWSTLQDEAGYTYFCPGLTIGPGFIVPEALVLKLFGVGWWQYRAFPLAIMFGLLVLLSAVAYGRGGAGAALLLQVWFWSLPLVSLKFAYEGYAEHVALFYSLVAFCVYGYIQEQESPTPRLSWFVVGLFLSLAYVTKSVYLLSAAAVGFHLLWRLYWRRLDWRQIFSLAIPAVLGFLLPWALYEGFRFYSIVSRFGMEGYRANALGYASVFRAAGSGMEGGLRGCLGRLWYKSGLLINIGPSVAVFAWPLMLAAGWVALRPRTGREPSRWGRCAATVLEVAAIKVVLVLAWFVLISPSRFTRHAWDALVLIMLLASIGIARAFGELIQRKLTALPLCVAVVVLAGVNLACVDRSSVELSCRLSYERVLRWYDSYSPRSAYASRLPQSLAFAPVFRRDLQEQAVQFLSSAVGPDDRIYYLHNQKSAELPPLVGKVFFPIQRCEEDRQKHHGKIFVVLGPFEIGDWPWRIEDRQRIEGLLDSCKDRIVFRNDLYVVIQGPVSDPSWSPEGG